MTQDVDIILKGLHCCSRVNPDCDNCPFTTKEVHCRELESDAEKLIRSLLDQLSYYKELYRHEQGRLDIEDEQDKQN